MTNIEILNKVNTLKEWKDLLEEAKTQVDVLKEEIKNIMIDMNTEELDLGSCVVRYTTVVSNRFDTTRFKKDFPETYKHYLKPSTSHRFSIN